MKKHYLKFGIFYCILALMLFLAAVLFYTKRKIDKVNEFTGSTVNNSYAMISLEVNADPRTLMRNMLSNWAFLSIGSNEDVGYYSAIIDVRNNNSILLEAQDFLEVSYYGEIEHETSVILRTERYLFTDGPMDLTEEETDYLYPRLRGSITNAKCDDIWIYEGELNISAPDWTRTIPIATYDQVDTSMEVPMEECIVRIDNITPCFMIGTGRKAALYNEAKSCAEVFFDQYLDGLTTGEVTFDRGIFTSRSSAVYAANGGDYLIVFYSVEKPLYMVLRDNIKVYIGAIAALLVVQGLIICSVRKLYHDQEDFEIRSRQLTYDIASDLKKPLTRTKSYIESWEACDDDKKKQNYSKKIIDEVDSMSDTVSKFLSSGFVRNNRR